MDQYNFNLFYGKFKNEYLEFAFTKKMKEILFDKKVLYDDGLSKIKKDAFKLLTESKSLNYNSCMVLYFISFRCLINTADNMIISKMILLLLRANFDRILNLKKNFTNYENFMKFCKSLESVENVSEEHRPVFVDLKKKHDDQLKFVDKYKFMPAFLILTLVYFDIGPTELIPSGVIANFNKSGSIKSPNFQMNEMNNKDVFLQSISNKHNISIEDSTVYRYVYDGSFFFNLYTKLNANLFEYIRKDKTYVEIDMKDIRFMKRVYNSNNLFTEILEKQKSVEDNTVNNQIIDKIKKNIGKVGDILKPKEKFKHTYLDEQINNITNDNLNDYKQQQIEIYEDEIAKLKSVVVTEVNYEDFKTKLLDSLPNENDKFNLDKFDGKNLYNAFIDINKYDKLFDLIVEILGKDFVYSQSNNEINFGKENNNIQPFEYLQGNKKPDYQNYLKSHNISIKDLDTNKELNLHELKIRYNEYIEIKDEQDSKQDFLNEFGLKKRNSHINNNWPYFYKNKNVFFPINSKGTRQSAFRNGASAMLKIMYEAGEYDGHDTPGQEGKVELMVSNSAQQTSKDCVLLKEDLYPGGTFYYDILGDVYCYPGSQSLDIEHLIPYDIQRNFLFKYMTTVDEKTRIFIGNIIKFFLDSRYCQVYATSSMNRSVGSNDRDNVELMNYKDVLRFIMWDYNLKEEKNVNKELQRTVDLLINIFASCTEIVNIRNNTQTLETPVREPIQNDADGPTAGVNRNVEDNNKVK